MRCKLARWEREALGRFRCNAVTVWVVLMVVFVMVVTVLLVVVPVVVD